MSREYNNSRIVSPFVSSFYLQTSIVVGFLQKEILVKIRSGSINRLLLDKEKI